MTQPILLFDHPACERHDPGPGHPDAITRLPALRAALAADGALAPLVVRRRAEPAGEGDLRLAHTATHVERVRAGVLEATQRGEPVWLDEDTAVSAGSWDAALAAAGCATAAAAAVAAGAPVAFALSRPPGHHATAHRAMGFCLFNNVAIAVRRLQALGAARRVLVLDWDAHHGNGTQDVFYDDPSVYVLSLHLDAPHYPGTGSAAERGAGRGHGTTRNVPLPAGTPAAEYRARFAEALDDALSSFAPELVVASVGLDALEGDPEGGLGLAPADLHALTAEVLERLPAEARRFVGVLEGGYAIDRIGHGLVDVLRALAGLPPSRSQDPC
jgi:acetoin utilization deacetylase AcuC-like enzyme